MRLRKLWGDGTIFKGSAVTFGALIYHGDAPFTRFRNPDLYASRDSTDGIQTLDQIALQITRLFLRKLSFGSANFTSFLHFVWIMKPSMLIRSLDPAQHLVSLSMDTPDPFTSLDFELGVHGTPYKGFWYDVGLFWMEFDNRTETRQFSPIDFIIVNTGSTRHRGLEGEVSYDFLAQFQHPPLVTVQSEPNKAVIDPKAEPVPGTRSDDFHPLQLIAFSNVQFLDAEFTSSQIPDQVGKTPAFAPDFLLKGGLTFRKQDCFNITFTSVYVAQQFWSDQDISLPTVPRKFLHTKCLISLPNTTSPKICDFLAASPI